MKKSFIKKALAIILSFTMVLPTCLQAFAANTSGFTDFPTGWSAEAMRAAVANGLLRGRTTTTIEPTGNLTRAELATVINRAFGATKMADISSFSDVSPKDWFYTEIAKAVNMQTFQGDGTGTMRPNDPITREEVFAVIARALVLETSDYSALSAHPDSGAISSWAKPYAAILSQKGYINGDENANLNPHSYITREEFAQLMHNIIKTYYVSSGTYTKAGLDSVIIRASGVILRDVTIEGDLIIGDGVGFGSVVFENVTVKGRILCRGGEDSVRLVNTTVGENIVVKDVNGVVHFDNYKSEDVFKNIKEITQATYKGDNYSISTGGSSSSSSPVTYLINVSGAGVSKSDKVKKGNTYTLPTPNMTNYPGFAGWRDRYGAIKNPGDTITVNSSNDFVAVYTYKIEHYFQNGANPVEYLRDSSKTQTKKDVLNATVEAAPLTTDIDGYYYNGSHASQVKTGVVNKNGTLVLKLYYNKTAIPADYTIEYYQLRIGGVPSDASDYVCTSSATISGKNIGDSVSVVPPYFTGFTYNPDPDLSKSSGTVLAGNALVLKLYYTRNSINISYNFSNGGSFILGYTPPVATTPYGSTITLPESDKVENGYDVFLGWSCNGHLYNGGEDVTIIDYDPQGGWVFTAVWQTTPLYTVRFMSLGSQVGEHIVPENTSVPQSVFDGLLLYEQEGYRETASVSPVYVGNEYTHKVKFGWYYNPETNKWEKFTSTTLVTDTIVDSSGVLTVEERSPQLSIYAYVDKIGTGFTFARYYEPTVVTVDGSGNRTVTGTRAMDTFKNFIWDSFSASTTPLQQSLQEQIEKGGNKALSKLREKGIIDANNNILPFEVFVRFADIIGKEELEEYIVDNAKESLSDNDELKDAIFEYFERMANSSNPDDVSEIKSLFKEAIDRAISSDATALDMIRDICETSLDDPDLIKTAFADFIGYNVTVTDEDLTSAATPTIIKWTKDLINTDPTFKANVKKRLVKYITDNLVSSDGFFDDVVHYNFRGTPFEDIQKPSSGLSTTDLIVDVVKSHFEAMTPDEIAVELGYADLQALFDARKDDILTVLVDDLDNPDFFNHVVSTTDFSGYTYAEVKPASTVSIIIDFIDNSIQTMSYEELADFAGYVDSAAMLDAAVDELGDIIATDIRDTSKSAYGDVLQEFIGQSSVPDTATSLDLFKMILTKVVSDAQTSGDYEELELMTGEDFSSMTQSEIDNFFANFSASLDDAAKVDAYVKAASFDEFEKADDLPSTPRELMARFVEIYFENDSEYALEKLGYTAIDILGKAKEYALEDAKERVADPADTFLVEQIAEHAGITYANYAAVPQNAFDLVIDVVKHKVNSSVTIDDNLAHELGYTDMNSLFAEIEHHILADVEDEIRTSTTKRNEYIAEYSGIVFTDPIEENAMDFIVQYAKAVLDPMTYDEIKAELLAFGMTEEEIDGHIEDYINDNIEEIVEDEFGYCPANIDSLNTKQFIIELVLYLFDNDADKREAIINEAVDYFVDKGDLSDFEEYVDHAIEHLRETDQLDDIIDEIIESRYRDVLDTMIHQLVSDDEFEIASDNSFILTAFEMQVKDYTFDDLIAKVPSQVFKIYPRAKLEAIYTRAYNELLLDIEEGKQANANGQTAYISTGLNFIINLVDDVYAVFRDRFAELLDEKATRNYYYRENQYLRELVRLTSVECVFDTNTGVGTGYAIKDYTDYYNLLVAIALVGDDAMKWYTEELSKDEFDQLVLDYEDLFVKYANIIADMVGDYADTGALPDKLDNNIVKAVEKKIKEKFGDKVDKILDWYEQSSFNRDYASDDYAKLRKGVNKAFESINITTDEAFNLIGRGYNLIVNKFDGLDSIDRITQIDQDTYEVTIKGKTIRVERKNTDTYTLTVQGKEITVSRKDDGNTYEIIAGSNKVVVSRAIVE